MSSDIMEKFWSAPPVTRTIVASMFVVSAVVHGGVLSGHRVIFYTPWIFKFPPELWRLLSSFLLTGGGFSFVFDLYFMWTYGSGLELNSPRFTQPGDFFTYVLFIATTIMFAYGGWSLLQICCHIVPPKFRELYPLTRYKITAGLFLKSMVFTSSLLIALIYTFAQDNRGKKAHFIIFQIPVELLPWAMLTLALILGGPAAALEQGTGVLAAHLYDFLTRLYPTFQGGRNFVQTPTAIRNFFGSGRPQTTQRAYGQAFRPGQTSQQPPSRGWTSGFSNSWGGRGTGRRLGGD